jgi:transposase-like protein
MDSSETGDTPCKSGEGKKCRYLSAEKKFHLFLEAQRSTEPIGELLRREGLYPTDLARIRRQVREGAIQRLGVKPGRRTEMVSAESHKEVRRQLQRKEREIVELSKALAALMGRSEKGAEPTATPRTDAQNRAAQTCGH